MANVFVSISQCSDSVSRKALKKWGQSNRHHCCTHQLQRGGTSAAPSRESWWNEQSLCQHAQSDSRWQTEISLRLFDVTDFVMMANTIWHFIHHVCDTTISCLPISSPLAIQCSERALVSENQPDSLMRTVSRHPCERVSYPVGFTLFSGSEKQDLTKTLFH